MNRVHYWSSSFIGSFVLLMGGLVIYATAAPALALDTASSTAITAASGNAAASGLHPQQTGQPSPGQSSLESLLPARYSAALGSGDLRNLSDQNLTQLASYWGVLSATERRYVLAEMRSRMARNRTQVQRLNIPRGRQYGKVIRKVRKVRQPDGSIIVETRVVRLTPNRRTETRSVSTRSANVPSTNVPSIDRRSIKPPTSAGARLPRVTFGIGFEQRRKGQPPAPPPRSSAAGEQAAANSPPVINVGQQPSTTQP